MPRIIAASIAWKYVVGYHRRVRASSVVICTLLVARASADPAAADQAAAEAKAAAAKNDFVTAAQKFRAAYAADPRPELMCNVGIAYYKAKDLTRAERYIDECEAIGKGLEQSFLDDVAKVHRALTAKLAADNYTPLDLAVEPQYASTAVEGGVPFDEPIVGSHRLWFPAGHYRLIVHAEGFTDRTIDVELQGHAPAAQHIALERAPVATGSGSDAGSGSDTGSGSAAGSGSGSATPAIGSAGSAAGARPMTVLVHRSKLPAIISSSVAVGAGLAGLGFWLVARSRASSAGTEPNPSIYADDVDSAHSWQTWSWVAGAVAGASAIVGGYFWYRSSTRVEIQPAATGGAVTLTGRW
jgi:hypothetical protein